MKRILVAVVLAGILSLGGCGRYGSPQRYPEPGEPMSETGQMNEEEDDYLLEESNR